jgi:hypothetical protein
MGVDISTQISGAQGGQSRVSSSKDRRVKPSIFPIEPPPGTGSGAFGGGQYRAPVSGDGAAAPRTIGNTGVETDPNSSFVRDLTQNNPADFMTDRQKLDAAQQAAAGYTNVLNPDGTVTQIPINPASSGNTISPIIAGSGFGTDFDEKGPTVIYNPQTQSFETTTPPTDAGTFDDGSNLADDENVVITDTDSTSAGGPGSINPGAAAKISDFGLQGTIDTELLNNWVNGLVAQGYTITDIIEDPGNPGYVTVVTNELDANGNPITHSNFVGISPQDDQTARLNEGRFLLEQERLALDTEIQREQLRIQEEIARVDQDIARDRIQHEQEVAAGNWQNALDVQDRIDQREKASRQLERDLFNANQVNLERQFELERAQFDLDKLEFFQSLSLAPANFADIFNITRGLAPTGAGGPLPQGIQRIGNPSDIQQTAAQDFRQNGINLGVNAPSGALPRVGAEQAIPQFNTTAPQLSFATGGDPTPVDSSGNPIVTGGEVGTSGQPEDVGDINAPAVPVDPNLLITNQANNPQQAQFQNTPVPLASENEGASFANSGIQQPGVQQPSFTTLAPESLRPQGGGSGVSGGTGFEADAGAPLPPGLQLAFNNQRIGAPQTPQNSIPLLSPQVLATLSPAEREAYYALAQMQGQFLPDFQALVAARGPSQEIASNQRVFA